MDAEEDQYLVVSLPGGRAQSVGLHPGGVLSLSAAGQSLSDELMLSGAEGEQRSGEGAANGYPVLPDPYGSLRLFSPPRSSTLEEIADASTGQGADDRECTRNCGIETLQLGPLV
jgi:hypothetical protein